MATSTVSAARAALFDLLRDSTSLADVDNITYGLPGGELTKLAIWVGGVRREAEFAALAGGRPTPPKNERFTIAVVVRAWLEDGTAQQVAERAIEYVDAIENIVGLNRTLSGSVISATVTSTEDDPYPADVGGHIDEAEIQITCTARVGG